MHKLLLVLGVLLWLLAAALTPGELAAAKRRDKLGPRTAITLVAYLFAAICVLRGLPPSSARATASVSERSPKN